MPTAGTTLLPRAKAPGTACATIALMQVKQGLRMIEGAHLEQVFTVWFWLKIELARLVRSGNDFEKLI